MSIEIFTYPNPYQLSTMPYWGRIKDLVQFCASQTMANGFSAEYSYFKYGDKSYAEKFAKELFEGFLADHKDILDTEKEIVVLPSPYMAIPTASNFLCFYFKIIV